MRQVASLPTLANDLGGLVQAPGKGRFSIEADRSNFGPVLVKMMWAKLHNLLFKGRQSLKVFVYKFPGNSRAYVSLNHPSFTYYVR